MTPDMTSRPLLNLRIVGVGVLTGFATNLTLALMLSLGGRKPFLETVVGVGVFLGVPLIIRGIIPMLIIWHVLRRIVFPNWKGPNADADICAAASAITVLLLLAFLGVSSVGGWIYAFGATAIVSVWAAIFGRLLLSSPPEDAS